jgi:hypothetical protein
MPETLESIAARVCWWQPPAETLAETGVFLCRVMTLGTWDDCMACVRHFGRDAMRDALRNAPPGILDARSWNFWHHWLDLYPIPPLPVRAVPV